MRKPENHYNQRIFLYNGIYNFIVSFAPPLTIFLILAIHLAVNKEASFTATYVYTLISYIGLIYGPVNSLPSTIVAAIQTSTCSKRMDKLMSME
jgi:ABC-type multidrug transport system fused ATPase/permease subunit